jgi:hypothetical protein
MAEEAGGRKEAAAQTESSAAQQSRLIGNMRYYAVACAVTALLGLFFMVVQNELAWVANTRVGLSSRFCADARDLSCDPRDAAQMFPVRNEKLTLNILRAVGVSGTTLISLAFLYLFYASRLAYMKTKNQLPITASILGAPPLRVRFVVEMALLAVHVWPGIDDVSLSSPTLYLVMSQVMWVRWIFLFRVVRYFSSLNSSNGRFISALTNVEFSSGFIFKTALKDRPVLFMTSVLSIILFSSAYAVRMVETMTCAWDRSLGCLPMSFEDALWFILVTMLTIGYGDVTSKTSGASPGAQLEGGGVAAVAALRPLPLSRGPPPPPRLVHRHCSGPVHRHRGGHGRHGGAGGHHRDYGGFDAAVPLRGQGGVLPAQARLQAARAERGGAVHTDHLPPAPPAHGR